MIEMHRQRAFAAGASI